VWVLADGSEAPAIDERPEGAVRDMPSLRVSRVISCDFVKTPAANVALFAAKVDAEPNNQPDLMTAQTIELAKHTEALSAKDAEIATLSAQHKDAVAALETKHAEAVTAFEAKIAETAKALEAAGAEKAELTKALDAEKAARATAEQYDIRKAGGDAIQARFTELNKVSAMPDPAKTDRERWIQYAELSAKDADMAEKFRAAHLSRK